MRISHLFLACSLLVQPAVSAAQGVELVPLDSVDRKVKVIYTPPSASVYADPSNTDTVFCALDAQTAWYKRAQVIPMQRVDATHYVVEAELPDSTYQLRIEICIPTDRVPDGIAEYKIGPKGGFPWVDTTVDAVKLHRLASTLANDPLLYNYYLWNDYFYPIEVDGKYIVPQERFEKTFALAAAYPRSRLGEFWIERMNPTKITDTAAVLRMIDAWRDSWDVDVLSSIATRRLDDKVAIYDPQDALWFIERSMKSAQEEIGFRTGENIFGSMGRIDMLAASRVRALDALGRYREAKDFGMSALRSASQQYGREVIAKALTAAALKANDSTTLTAIAKLEKPVIKNFSYTVLDGTTGTMQELRGKIVVMDFWFAGCAGCAAEHKALNDLALRYADKSDVIFLSVSLNDATTLRHYLSKKPLAFQTIPDGQAICDLNGVTAFPTHVILDKDGNTVLWETGGSTLAVENFEIALITTLGR